MLINDADTLELIELISSAVLAKKHEQAGAMTTYQFHFDKVKQMLMNLSKRLDKNNS